MIGRSPSLQKPRTDFFSGDPAFVQPPELAADATPEDALEHEKVLKEHVRKWEQARESGDFDALRVEGLEPTPFTMRPLKGELFRKLHGKVTFGEMHHLESAQIAFRACIVDVVGFGKAVAQSQHREFGMLANVDITNDLDAIDHRIVTELGTVAINRASRINPKS